MLALTLSQQKPRPARPNQKAGPSEKLFAAIVEAVEEHFQRHLRPDPERPDKLHEAIRYSLLAGGKRLRPVLVVLSCQSCGGSMEDALPAATAMEMIHTFSLIHDDLPAMDDDDLRRGLPTNHKVFGEALAVLAGDALVTYAFEVLAREVSDAAKSRELCLELACGSGASGMIGGQAIDIEFENKEGSRDVLERMHTLKTAKLFACSCRMGAISAGAAPSQKRALGEFGLLLGQAFQIVDDLLDVVSNSEVMGKTTQKDDMAGKLTFPAMLGIDASRQAARSKIEQAKAALLPLGEAADELIRLADMTAERTH